MNYTVFVLLRWLRCLHASMASSILMNREKSESEIGVVNSRLCEFHVCWVHIGANLYHAIGVAQILR